MEQTVKGKRIVVLGAGASGIAAMRYLENRGAHVTLLDDLKEGCERTFTTSLAEEADGVVASPGVPLDHAWFKVAHHHDLPIYSELDFPLADFPGKVLAITGSLGKSTVATFCHQVLERAGFRSVLCGNIGYPVSAALNHTIDKPDWVVVEVSSFQLETACKSWADVAVLLNVFPNHLDRHGTMENYSALKHALRKRLKTGGVWITDKDILPETKKGQLIEHPLFPGNNLGVAKKALISCGCNPTDLKEGLKLFSGLAHRRESLGLIHGVEYINDSKSTTLTSMLVAIKEIQAPIRLLAGGVLKENPDYFDFSVLANQVECAYLFGKDASLLEKKIKKHVPCEVIERMDVAIQRVCSVAKPGEVVLLSPGGTSFDAYKNFEARGDEFRGIINKFKKMETQQC